MSFASARTAFSAFARSSLRSARVNSASRMGARRMNSSHATPTKKGDMPWIIGSAVVFGPAFLYLLSPSARKNIHHAHNDAHDFPGYKEKKAAEAAEAHEPVLQKDGEDIADVSRSFTRAEQDDVPKTELDASTAAAAADALEAPSSKSTATDSEPHISEPSPDAESQDSRSADKTISFEGDKTSVNQGVAREAAKNDVPPKEADS